MHSSFENQPASPTELWQAAYRILEQSLAPIQLQLWVQPLEFVKAEKTEKGLIVHFITQNDFIANRIRTSFCKDIETAFTQVTGQACQIELAVQPATGVIPPIPTPPLIGNTASLEKEEKQETQIKPHAPTQIDPVRTTNLRPPHSIKAPLETRYVFDNFIVGKSNQFAHASAIAVAENPGRQYNPLFIYSAPGLGKTHILQAIGNHVLSKDPNFRVAFLSAESFMNEMVDSIQHKRMAQFRTKFRDSYDIILMDDIQFIAGKPGVEEEFFHTFNTLYASKRQIVVTSDRPPKEIADLEERIRTRFEWGLVVSIEIPEIETRIAILKAKAERDDIYLPEDVTTFLATHVKTNVRELEGLLIRLQMQSSLTGAEISLEMAKQELKLAIPEEGSQLTVEVIQTAVAKHYHLRIQDLKATSRMRTIALPRQIAMYLIRKYTGLGFKEIGHCFGGKDHTTILHAYNKIEEGLKSDAEIRDAVEAIQNML